MFRQGGIPKRLIPGTIALGAFTFTMDSLPGTPQIQNIIPTTFFKHQHLAAPPWLGVIGSIFILILRHGLPGMAPPRGHGGRRRLWHRAGQRTGGLRRQGKTGQSAAGDPAVGAGGRHQQAVHRSGSPRSTARATFVRR
jgi:hypothetical protein